MSARLRFVVGFCLVLLWPQALRAQGVMPEVAPATSGGPSPWMLGAVTGGMAAAALGVGATIWWLDNPPQAFHLRDRGFFGRHTYGGGADKSGHFYSTYLTVRAMTGVYELMGVPQKRAALYGGAFVLAMANGVELIDGFTEYGFEYGDAIMNTLGIALAMVCELSPTADSLVGLRVGYVPTPELLERDKNYFKTINDYAGQVVYLDLKLAGVATLVGHDGPWRYLVAGINYGTYGYAPRSDAVDRRRNLGVHVGLSIEELLAGQSGTVANVARTIARYYAPPFTTVSLVRDLNHGEWIWNFGVANRLEL